MTEENDDGFDNNGDDALELMDQMEAGNNILSQIE